MRSLTAIKMRRGLVRALAGFLLSGAATAAVALTSINSLADERELPRWPFSEVLGEAKLSELQFEYAMRDGKVTDRMVEGSKEGSVTSPLSTEPFLFAALRYFPTKDAVGSAEAEPFLREVLLRDPRSRPAHLLLLRRALAEKRIDEVLFHLGRLNQLEPDMVGALMRAVGEQIRSTEDADEVAQALYAHEELVAGIADGVANGKAPPEVVIRFVRGLAPTALAKSAAAPALIDRLIRAGDVSEARVLWGKVNGLAPSNYSSGVYDPEFSDQRARPPFGWTYNQDASGVAEWTKPGAVYVEYYGRRSGPLLSQTLALRPGRYRATSQATSQSPNLGSLATQVSCAGGAPILGQAQIRSANSGNVALSFEFKVPALCPAQIIAIVGVPSEFRSGGAITLHRLQISRVD